jgi:hypothetical protein
MSISREIPAGEPVARLLTREQARRIAANIATGSDEERTLDHSPRQRNSSRRPIRSPGRRAYGTRL